MVTVPLPFCVHLLWGKLLGHQEPHWNTQSLHLVFPITRPDPSFPSGTSATFGERHWRTSLSLSFPTDLMVLGVFSTLMQRQSVLSQFRKHPAEVNNQMSPSAILTLLSRFFLAGHRKWRSAWRTSCNFPLGNGDRRRGLAVWAACLQSCSGKRGPSQYPSWNRLVSPVIHPQQHSRKVPVGSGPRFVWTTLTAGGGGYSPTACTSWFGAVVPQDLHVGMEHIFNHKIC